jgi:CheY-like chemotaxis protein
MAESESLTTHMARGALPAEEVVRLGKAIADAVSNMGVHGELWPGTITIDDGGVDVSPAGAEDRSQYGHYAAPERILGKLANYESDVFSIGAILFHALAGRTPFRGDTPAQVMMAICTEPPLDLPPEVPRELATIVQRCLSREPSARYASPAVVRDALDSLTSRREFAGRRVLLADDEPDIRDAYARVAGRMGIDIDLVGSGREAIDALKARRYDLALLDLNMPRLSGWEVLDFLRNRAEIRPRRLFIITAYADQRVSDADRDVVNAVIYKPVEPSELRALLAECLGGGDFDLRNVLRTTKHIDYGSHASYS